MTDEPVSEEKLVKDVVMIEKKPSIWTGISLGIGFTLLPTVVLMLGYLNVNPSIWRSFPEKSVFERGPADTSIAWTGEDLKDPPLEFVSDKFSLVSLETDVPKIESFWNLFVTPPSRVLWTWEYQVKNLTSSERSISVSYFLIDKNGSKLADGSEETVSAKPDQTVTLTGEGFVPYGLVSGVVGSSWGIR